jgi:hypothetical protein
MAIKNVIQENRAQINKFSLSFTPGVGAPTFVSVSGLEEELDRTELPDRTTRTGGRKKSIEFEVVQPAHHDIEVAAMTNWYQECQDPVSPTHLKVGSLIVYDTVGSPRVKRTLMGCWLSKRVDSDLDLNDDGAQATITWTVNADEMLPA